MENSDYKGAEPKLGHLLLEDNNHLYLITTKHIIVNIQINNFNNIFCLINNCKGS